MVSRRVAYSLLGSIALLGCSSKDGPGGGGLETQGQGGLANAGGRASIVTSGGAAGLAGAATGGSGPAGAPGSGGAGGAGAGGSAGVTCMSYPTVICNGACLYPQTREAGRCHLLVPFDSLQPTLGGMDLDSGELFVTRGDSVYKVGVPSGTLDLVTTVDGSTLFELKASGDSIYFIAKAGTENTLMSAPRAGGAAKTLTSVGGRFGATTPYLRVAGGFVVYEQDPAQPQSVPIDGGEAMSVNADYEFERSFDTLPDGTVFLMGSWPANNAGLFRGTLPFPFAEPGSLVLGGVTSRAIHAESDYVYFLDLEKGFQRVPSTGGTVETLAAVGAASLASVFATTKDAVAYTTDTGVEVVPADGSGIEDVASVENPTSLSEILVDETKVYILRSESLLAVDRP